MAMERTRVAKVEGVVLARRGEQVKGTLHLTPHHLIFVYQASNSNSSGPPARPKEVWITYPIISFCTFRPSHPTSRQPSSIRLRCRDFTFVCFYLQDPRQARDVYESIKAWTCKLGRLEKLYAFTYKAQGLEKDLVPSGWSVYNPMEEWRRQGIVDDSKKLNWRISKINHDYNFSPTYPSLLAVPTSISDNHLNYAGRYRSRARIPVLSYLHPVNNCTITRCSQPMLGVRQHRSTQDEALLAAIFSTTRADRPLSHISSPELDTQPLQDLGRSPPNTDTEAIEDAVIAKLRGDNQDDQPAIYGAQQRNLIVDARPTINALAMQAAGMGSENMENYKFATKAYLGIDNIHVMRDSLNKVIDTLKDSDLTPLPPSIEQLHKSNWLKHLANMLDGVGLIARQVGLQHSHVLIHCSDGWDRTSQLSALSQLCLDPYYRTLEGFIVLVEKDWLSFGHRFGYRSGFLNSDKWFNVENERVAGRDEDGTKKTGTDAMVGAQKTFENAFLSAKGFFTKHNNDSRESINVDSDPDGDNEGAPTKPSKSDKHDRLTTKVKETAPIFHQFLDATYQLLYQYPTRFEFNERFLRRLLYHLYSCQYGTFLFDSEKERVEARISERTTSVWNYFLARRKEFINDTFDPVTDDNVRGKERLIFPKTDKVRWWASVFGRTDEEMNGPSMTNGAAEKTDPASGDETELARARLPVLIGVETATTATGVASPLSPNSTKPTPSVVETGTNVATNISTSVSEPVPIDTSLASSGPRLPEVNGSNDEQISSGPAQAELLKSLSQTEVESVADRNTVEQDPPAPDEDHDPLGLGSVTVTDMPMRKKDKRREQLEELMQ